MSLRKKIAAAVLTATAVFSVSACGLRGGNQDPSAIGDTIRIGTTDAQQKQWQVFEEELTAQGIKAEIVSFGDYNLPNQATIDGQVDVTNFQHIMFLANFNNEKGADLVPIGATEIVPLALYYKDHNKISDVEEAGQVVIPNDTTNQGRALNVLAAAGLITLKNSPLIPTPADVDTDKSKVKVVPVDAAQTATSYLDGTPAIVNNSYLSNAKIDPETAITKDDPSQDTAKPYINTFVTTKAKENDERLARLVEIWHSAPVQTAIQEQSNGTSIEDTSSKEELKQVLENTQLQLKEAQ